MLFCDLCIFKYSSSVFLYVCMCLYWKIENVYKSLYLFCGYIFCLCYFCMHWYIFWIHWCKCIFWKNTCKIAVASCICTYSLYNRHKNMHNLTWSYIYINASLCMYRTYCIIFVYTKHTSHVGDLSWNLSIIGSFRPYMQILFSVLWYVLQYVISLYLHISLFHSYQKPMQFMPKPTVMYWHILTIHANMLHLYWHTLWFVFNFYLPNTKTTHESAYWY